MAKVAIIGGGPAGIMAAIIAKENNPMLDITVFEKNDPLKTLLYTGGGRCNLTYFEQDFKAFAANYPRGEKFLYSVFNVFSYSDTMEFFKSIGVTTYIQPDSRVFPHSDSAREVREALLDKAYQLKVGFKTSEIKNISEVKDGFSINNEKFEKLVIATGGRYKDTKYSGFALASKLGHSLTPLKPALCGLETKESWVKDLSGLSFKSLKTVVSFGEKTVELMDDLLFTHKGISGPLAYKISSVFAFENYSSENPILVKLNFIQKNLKETNEMLQNVFDNNPKKTFLNLVSSFMIRSLAQKVLKLNNISEDKKVCEVNKNERQIIAEALTELKISVTKPTQDGEIVTAGGVVLDEINPKTMESKLIPNLYFCGEVLNIDGFCGGFNLQNCWSTGYLAGVSLAKS